MSTPHARLLTDLHERHRASLERLVTSRVRDPELAADVVSEAFVRLHRGAVCRTRPGSAGGLAHARRLEPRRERGPNRRVVGAAAPRLAEPAAEDGPAELVAGRDDLRRVVRALADLSQPDRELVVGAADWGHRDRARRPIRHDRRLCARAPVACPIAFAICAGRRSGAGCAASIRRRRSPIIRAMLEPDAGIFGSRPGPDPGVGGCGWARQGWPQAVLITGEPGIGRTIVAAAVADGLRADWLAGGHGPGGPADDRLATMTCPSSRSCARSSTTWARACERALRTKREPSSLA